MGSEYVQFGAALVFFLAILIGSYWFVYAPNRRERKRENEEQ